MKFSNLLTTVTLVLILPALISLSGCNNPADSGEDEHEEHHQPAGAILKMNGAEIVRYENQEVSGQIEVNAGEETALITLYFLDEHGEEFQPDEPENSLGWHGIETSIAEIVQHADDTKWSFHVQGINADSTSVIFELKHGDHADFETAEIPVIVH